MKDSKEMLLYMYYLSANFTTLPLVLQDSNKGILFQFVMFKSLMIKSFNWWKRMCTVKKEKTIFLIYKDIQKRLGAVIYEEGLPNM